MPDDQASRIPTSTQGERVRDEDTPPQAQADRTRCLIVVARDQSDLWRHLSQTLAEDGSAEVVLDRRYGGVWQWAQSREFQARGADRRRPSNLETDLRARAFLIVPRAVSS